MHGIVSQRASHTQRLASQLMINYFCDFELSRIILVIPAVYYEWLWLVTDTIEMCIYIHTHTRTISIFSATGDRSGEAENNLKNKHQSCTLLCCLLECLGRSNI